MGLQEMAIISGDPKQHRATPVFTHILALVLATLGNLGFPAVKSCEHEWLQVILELGSRFCSYWCSGIKWVRMFSLSLLFWQFKKLKNHDFQLPRNLVHVTEYPIGGLDFEGSVNGVGQRKRTLNT